MSRHIEYHALVIDLHEFSGSSPPYDLSRIPYGFQPSGSVCFCRNSFQPLSLWDWMWEPFSRNGQVDVLIRWAHQVAQRDLQDVRMLMLCLPSSMELRPTKG